MQDYLKAWLVCCRWYEGGGLYRHVNLVKANKLHIAEDGIFAYSNISHSKSGLAAWNGGQPRQMTAESAVLHASVEVYNDDSTARDFTASFTLIDPQGASVSTVSSGRVSAAAGGSTEATASIQVSDVQLWNSASPTMYTVAVAIESNNNVVDAMNISTGFRSLHYDSTDGFALNQEHFKVRTPYMCTPVI